MSEALRFLALTELAGLAAVPAVTALLGRLPGGALGLAKPLGLLAVTWAAWVAGFALPYGTPLAVAAVAVVTGGGAALGLARRRGGRPLAGPGARRAALQAEAVFLVAFAAALLLRSFAPDVWGTEAPMDMALVTATDRSGGFPPHSPWLAPERLDYYYLGHLTTALLSRLAGVAPDRGYNVALALTFALTATATYTLGAALGAAAGRRPARFGLAATALVLVLGTPASGWLLHEAGDVRDFDWFAASRVIPGTINEFPAFSFVLGDLHAHVLALPATVLVAAFAVDAVLAPPRTASFAAAGALTGALYATNSWSAPVAAALLAGALLARRAGGDHDLTARRLAIAGGAAALAAALAALPFLLTFDSPAKGVGLVGTRRSFPEFLADQGRVLGLLLWLAAGAVAWALRRSRRPLRALLWPAAGFALAGSALAAADLTGALLAAVLLAVALLQLVRRASAPAERAVWLLLAVGLGCVLVPELVYVRDEFDGSDLFRMNTIFKLGYQAWLLLALAGAGVLALARERLGRRGTLAWGAGAAVLALSAAAYPLAAPDARTRGFADGPHLDGLRWLARSAPGDPAAIAWLRAHARPGAVVLESAGDDYSAFGHARISTFSGQPAVLGWAGHELQWGHHPDGRRADVDALYRTTDAALARRLLRRYRVAYVVVGPLERADHGDAGVAKWDALGRRVHNARGTAVWAVAGAPPRP